MDIIEKFANELRSTLDERRIARQKSQVDQEANENSAENVLEQFWKDSDKLISSIVFPSLERAKKKLQFDSCSCSVRQEGEWRIREVIATFAIQEGCVDTEAQFEVGPCAKNRTIKISGRAYSIAPDVDWTKEFFEKELVVKDVSPQIIEELFESTLRTYLAECLEQI
jgi:hypothetical protein